MKNNHFLIIILLLIVNTAAFSTESRLSLGFEYGNFFEKRTDGGVDIETYLGAPGLDFSTYHLWGNFGFFQDHSFLFPNNITSNIDGYNYFFQYSFTMGPAFKITFTEKLDMTFGIGFSFGPVIGELDNHSLTLFKLGIGGDAGFSFFVNKWVFINTGGIFSYHFLNRTSTGTGTYDKDGDENKKSEWSKNYNMAGIRPYIRIGFWVGQK
jgi:hypothetical protein